MPAHNKLTARLTPIMTGGFISNRDGRRPVRSVRAGSNASALSSVFPPIDKSRRHFISNRRAPMKGTSATRAVAWDSDGTLNDPHKSDSTGRRLEVASDHYLVILRILLGLFEFLVCQVLGFSDRANCREGENPKASPSSARPGIDIYCYSGFGLTTKFPPLQYSLKFFFF